MWVAVVVLLCAGAASAQSSCKLGEVASMQNLNETALSGSWFKARCYYSPGYSEIYENHARQIQRNDQMTGLAVREYIRNPPGAQCSVYQDAFWRRLWSGVYEYYHTRLQRYVRTYVVDTDYDRYLTEFTCLETSGNICLRPEVSFYLRHPISRTTSMIPIGLVSEVEKHLRMYNLCVQANQFYEIPAREPPCVPITHSLGGTVAPPKVCSLDQVKVMPSCEVEKMTGSWYKVRWYYSPGKKELTFDSHAYSIRVGENQGLVVTEHVRMSPESPCIIVSQANWRRISNGIYEYYRESRKTFVRSHMIYSDYDRYLIGFACYIWDSNNVCAEYELAFFTREPLGIRAIERPAPSYYEDQIKRNNLCVDLDKFFEPINSREPCVGVTTPLKISECALRNVKMTQLDEKRLSGSWFETRWYYSKEEEEEEKYENYVLVLTAEEDIPGLEVDSHVRYPGSKCRIHTFADLRRIENGVYETYSTILTKNMRVHVVYTDYDRYLTVLVCHYWTGDMCTEAQVALYRREPPTRRREISLYPEDVNMHLKRHNIDKCVDTNKFMETPAKEPPCEEITDPMGLEPSDPCLLSGVNVMKNLDESRLSGSWYEVRFYYSDRQEQNPYENYALGVAVDRTLPGLRVVQHIRIPPGEPCSILNDARWRRLDNGVYEYYNAYRKSNARSYVVYTDYDRYLTELICFDWSGDICRKPEITFYLREPPSQKNENYQLPEDVATHLKNNHLGQCVDEKNIFTVRTRDPPCTPVTNPVLGLCALNKIKAMANVDETRLSGSWYEVRWYYSNEKEDMYENYALSISADETLPGLRVVEYIRFPAGEACKIENDASRRRIENGVYQFFKKNRNRNARSYVIYTDYDHYLTEFICLEWNSNTCLKPEVSFYLREPPTRSNSAYHYGGDIMKHLQKYNLHNCVDKEKFILVPTRQPPCTAITNPLCMLSRVKHMKGVDEKRLSGSWYEVRWYVQSSEEEEYENYSLNITADEGIPGLVVREFIRYPPSETCLHKETRRHHIGDGVYLYYKSYYRKNARSYIVYTDYDRHLTEYICLAWRGDMCLESHVSLYLREPPTIANSALHFPENVNMHLRKYNLHACVDFNAFENSPSREPPCTPVTHPITMPTPPVIGKCVLSKVKVMQGIDENLLSGSWYEVRWYYSKDKEEDYENYALRISVNDTLPGLHVVEYIRYPLGEPCSVDNDAMRRRIDEGVYAYYNKYHKKNARSYIIYTDYKRYLTELICLEWNNDICLKSEVSFYLRVPPSTAITISHYPEDVIMHLSKNNLLDCVDQNKYMRVLTRDPPCIPVTNPLTNLPLVEACVLSNVPMMKALDEERLSGSWYEVRWYYSNDKEEKYENYALRISVDAKIPGLEVIEYIREPPGAACNVFNDAKHYRIGNGVYEYYNMDHRKNARTYIVYTNYDRHLTELICLEWEGDLCKKSEVALYLREPPTNSNLAQHFPEDVAMHLKKYNLRGCVDQNKFFQVPTRDPPCTPITNRLPPGPPPSTDCACMCQHYDKELLTLQKQKEELEEEKLKLEKETLELEKQLISMQLATMRSGSNGQKK